MTESTTTQLRDIEVVRADGTRTRFGDIAPGAAIVVNVASKCGFAPQYAGLEALAQEFAEQGLTVVGMPCNQFLKQEPGDDAAIGEFCQLNYGVTFPLLAKSAVNGRKAEPLYKELRHTKDSAGLAGIVLWNFEKFVISVDPADGSAPTVQRFRSTVTPEAAEFREAVIAALAPR